MGQVAPVRVVDAQNTASRANNQPSTSATGDRSTAGPAPGSGVVRGRGRGVMPPGGARGGQIRRPGADHQHGGDKPDLQKLGMKFGGQISITSSNNQSGGKKGEGGVSVMKMKGDVAVGSAVSIKDAANNKPGTSSSSSGPSKPIIAAGESSKADTNNQDSPRVKEEPGEEQEPEAVENFDDYGDGDYADGGDDEYPGADMYADDPDFTGENVDADDGMDVDLYNQYKNRGDDGEYDEDEAPLDDEYEEET